MTGRGRIGLIVLAAATLAAGIAAAVAVGSGAPDAAAPVDGTAAARRSSAPAPSLGSSRRDTTVGLEHRYAVRLDHVSHLAGASGQGLRIAVDGEWAVAALGGDEHGQRFVVELRQARPVIARAGQDVLGPVGAAALTAALARPSTFTVAADGRLVALGFAADLDPTARGVLATLAAAVQVVEGDGGASWDAIESDSLGDHRVRYTRDGAALRKHKLGYGRAAGGGADATVLASAFALALGADGWPERIAGRESIRVGLEHVAVTVDGEVELRHLGVAERVAVEPTGLEPVAVAAAGASARAAADADRELVDGASLADLLAELAQVEGDAHAAGFQYLRLGALFRLDAAAARDGAARVEAGLEGRQAGAVIGALGEAGTPEAQAALSGLVASDALDDSARAHVAMALGLTDAPTAATLTALAAASRGEGDAAAGATLALGNAALHLGRRDPAAAAAQVDELLARLGRAGTVGERVLCLRALGNTGDARILPALEAALGDGSAAVRTAAAEALRLVPGPRADAAVVAALADRAGPVRGAAVFAVAFRDLAGFVAPLAQLVRRDPDPVVRRAIVELAASRMADVPALREIVAYAAAHDGDAEVRAMAQRMLNPAGA